LPTALHSQAKFKPGSEHRTKKVDSFVQGKMTANHIPGLSLAVVRDGKIVFAKGYGMANLELSAPATEKTVYHIASITKTFTAIAAMMLVQEGKISLEEPISKYLLDLPEAWRSVRIRHLLNHTSGIKSFSNNDEIPCPVGKSESEYGRADVLKEVACLPLEFSPGERWSYGDTGYHLLGMLIEKVSGRDYEQFLSERIFKPLEMRDTRLNTYDQLVTNRADGYSHSAGKFRNAGLLPLFEFANAGLVSTALDMAKLNMAFTGEKLLRRATLQEMMTNAKLNSGEIVLSYGLGVGLTPFRGRKRVGHPGGGGLGFATAFTHFINENVSVVVLTNTNQPAGSVSEMANEIAAFYFLK
jgi:CubicO group peptidase (beta-lactamase class C family)